jgi:hypothetical protein
MITLVRKPKSAEQKKHRPMGTYWTQRICPVRNSCVVFKEAVEQTLKLLEAGL